MNPPRFTHHALRNLCVLTLAALLGGHFNKALAQNTSSSAQKPSKDAVALGLLNVRDLGARGDGKADDTSAFERAILRARRENLTVYVLRGDYRITRPLRLEGQAMLGQFAGGWPADSLPLPTLHIEQTTGPGLTLGAYSSLHGIALFYDLATKFPTRNAPPAISLAGQGPSISSVRLQYPYDGIITAPNAQPGRARISDVFMVSPKHDGLYLTKSLDVAQLSRIEVWCNIAMSSGAGFKFGRNDDCQLSDLFAFNCDTGFLFETDPAPLDKAGGTFYGSLTNCATDACGAGYVVRGDHRLNIANTDLVNHRIGLDLDGINASVRLSNCMLQSNGSPCIVVRHAANLSISNTVFTRTFSGTFPYIEAQNCGSLTINANQFKPFSPGIVLGAGVQRAVVTGNIFESPTAPLTDLMSPTAKKIVEPNIVSE